MKDSLIVIYVKGASSRAGLEDRATALEVREWKPEKVLHPTLNVVLLKRSAPQVRIYVH